MWSNKFGFSTPLLRLFTTGYGTKRHCGDRRSVWPESRDLRKEILLRWPVNAFIDRVVDRVHRIGVLMSGFATDKRRWPLDR